jgi:hypothetical protein
MSLGGKLGARGPKTPPLQTIRQDFFEATNNGGAAQSYGLAKQAPSIS